MSTPVDLVNLRSDLYYSNLSSPLLAGATPDASSGDASFNTLSSSRSDQQRHDDQARALIHAQISGWRRRYRVEADSTGGKANPRVTVNLPSRRQPQSSWLFSYCSALEWMLKWIMGVVPPGSSPREKLVARISTVCVFLVLFVPGFFGFVSSETRLMLVYFTPAIGRLLFQVAFS